MTVLQLWSDAHRETSVDIFVSDPFDFEAEYPRALCREIGAGVEVRFTSLPTLLEMKRRAGRPQDRIDIDNLLAKREPRS